MAETMTHDDRVARFQRGVLACYQAAAMLAEHDLAQLLGDAELAQSVGPVLDPTLWRERTKALGEDISALRAALPLHAIGRKLRRLALEGADAAYPNRMEPAMPDVKAKR